ncbi:GntR family transcriptional regulator [Rhodococcus sp. B10]|uniref:FCD domain-containing protein n=1 Tax=Rhodococcus sp. B10 TaxID=2695876 RepID=UPI00142FBD3F|nr:HTH-type transcriptional regulator McbR [Rhodococcus sp. B10]
MSTQDVSTRTEAGYRRIRDDIVSGVLSPGTTLTEAGLTGPYGMSRTPIRDALSRLEHDGLLRRVVRGYEVPQRDVEEIIDIYNVRIALEVTAVVSACERATTRDISALNAMFERACSETDRAVKTELNRKWHLSAVSIGKNRTASELLERTVAQLAPYNSARIEVHENLEETDAEHRGVMEAIASRDQDAARRLLSRHLERVRDVRIRAWEQDVILGYEH